MRQLLQESQAYKIFCREAEAGRLAHAYMLSFEDTAYLRDALKIFALRFFGVTENDALGGRIMRESFSDCRIFPEQGKKFNVEAAAALIEDSAMKPSEGEKKLYLISSFEECSAVVQNKLLKVIEEPPAGVSFILGAASLSPVLSTILSRVRLLEIPPFTSDGIYAALERKNPGGALNRQAAESCGGVLSAAEALAGGQFSEIHSAALDILSSRGEGDAGIISLKYGDTKYKREILSEVQRLCLAAVRAPSGNADRESRALLSRWSVPALLAGAEIFGGAVRDLKFNAYFPALLYSAMLSMTEENNKWQKLSE